MAAPTEVNEGTPREPEMAGPPGSATAELEQDEAAAGDQAAPAGDLKEPAPAGGLKEPAGGLKETAGGLNETAGGLKETVPAPAMPAEPAAATGPPEDVRADAEPEVAHAEAAPAEQAVRAEAAAHAEARTPEAEPAAAEPAGTELAGAERAEADGLGPEDGQESRAAEADGQESRAAEGSGDVGPLAVVGIIVGVIALVGVAAGVLAMVTHGFRPKTVVSYRPAAVFGLRPGQCVNSGSGSLSFTVVSCASPHDAEVFARFSLPAATWPGSAAVRQEAGEACASRLSGYLNPKFATIGLSQQYVYPNRDAWEADQRTVVCEVSSGNGQLTGSVRAAG